MKKLTQKRLKKLLHYDPETGIITKKTTTSWNSEKGDIVKNTQTMIRIEGKEYSILRLIWLYMYGNFPIKNIKHIDGNLQNNKLNNLEENFSTKEKPKKLTQKRLKELLHYNPETGIFTRKVTTAPNAIKGSRAGTQMTLGYREIHLDNKRYYEHRLAWLYVHGYLPENEIDHINRIKDDTRICNLREISHSCNMKNINPKSSCKTGIPGVFKSKTTKRWWSYISLGPGTKRGWLGSFKNFDEAVCTRLAAEQCLNYRSCNSQSPAYQYVQEMLKRPKKRKLPKIIV
jgi:hypothetical protein